MTLLREVFGALAGLAALGSLTLGTHALRRRFLSTLHGPPVLLADVVGAFIDTRNANDPTAFPRTPSS